MNNTSTQTSPANCEPFSHLLAKYSKSPVLQFLIQSVPVFGSGIDAAAREIIQKYQWNKFRIFFEELANGSVPLSEDLIKDDDFLFCYFKTMDAVQRSRKEEKIRFLARLLRGAFTTTAPRGADELEVLLAIADELTHEELRILSLLSMFEKQCANPNEPDLQVKTAKYWDNFRAKVATTLGLSEDMLGPMLVRIQRSGCYQAISGTYLSYSLDRGTLTPLYHRIEAIAGRYSDLCGEAASGHE